MRKTTSRLKAKTKAGTKAGPKTKSRAKPKFDKKSPPRGTGRIIRKQSVEEDAEESAPEMKPKAKAAAVFKGFSDLWSNLFATPIHLDSALSKQPRNVKSILAQILPTILLKPASLAEALGVGVQADEPWTIDLKKMGAWRPAQLMAERIYEMMTQGVLEVDPMKEDFPPRMISEWKATWGQDVLIELVDTLAREAPLSLRASRRVGAQGLMTALTSGAKLPVRVEVSNLVPLGVRLSGYAPVLGTESYEKGGFEIQDEGSQFMALFALWPDRYGALLRNRPGRVQKLELPAPPPPKDPAAWTVIDACAGAGGKSLAIADALKGKGRVYSYDTSEVKLQALRRRATRAGLNNIQAVAVKEGNESEVVNRFRSTAQVVLVDAPCSGWGVLRRNPDIKWRQADSVLTRMPEIQIRLLTQYSELVAPGGRLVYGVCTFRKSETVDIVSQFLEKNPQFKAQEGGFLGPGPCDGFFMQSFIKGE